MSSAAVPQRILHAAGRPVRFAMAAGAHSLAVLEQQPQTNGDLRRSLGTFLGSPATEGFHAAACIELLVLYVWMLTAQCHPVMATNPLREGCGRRSFMLLDGRSQSQAARRYQAWLSTIRTAGAGTERRQCLGCFNPLPLPPDLIQLAESASKSGASHKQVRLT